MSGKKYVIILAAGEGKRAGGDIPKQFRKLCGKPIVWWSMNAFYRSCENTEIIAVVHPGFFEDWRLMWNEISETQRIPHVLCCGGRTRAESVKNGLMMIREELKGETNSIIAIHDSARPLVSERIIRDGWDIISRRNNAGLNRGIAPVVKMTDSLRKYVKEGDNSSTVSVVRSNYVAVQTPQISTLGMLWDAYKDYEYPDGKKGNGKDNIFGSLTDDLSFLENIGCEIELFEGDSFNMKVTNPEDFVIAEALMNYLDLSSSQKLANI